MKLIIRESNWRVVQFARGIRKVDVAFFNYVGSVMQFRGVTYFTLIDTGLIRKAAFDLEKADPVNSSSTVNVSRGNSCDIGRAFK